MFCCVVVRCGAVERRRRSVVLVRFEGGEGFRGLERGLGMWERAVGGRIPE